ncbi:LssY C-terminal domain-containing protein [Cupriavidus sp. D384]|uniref:LssY C-terminal domain-containing protein n=1 Tax=Cupriavidus sp. D384 TaxID=1538095 RepID=UPI00082C53E0|nr:LssY C-terminal domain-containing protein [Cupriavidus sp. D384]
MIAAPRVRRWPAAQGLAMAACLLLLLVLAGCSTWRRPAEGGDEPLRARAVSMTKDGVTLSATVPSKLESHRLLGANIGAVGVQPVWIEVHNGTAQSLALLRTGTDPDYFSPLEVAWSLHGWFTGGTNAKIDDWFNHVGFRNPIPPGESRSGIVFTNPARGTKLLNVDLLGNQHLVVFTLFLRVPDDSGDPDFSRSLFTYPDPVAVDYQDLASLRAALERLPCCATDASSQHSGDPLNGVAIGGLEDFGAAMVRRNYRRNQEPFDDAQYVFGRVPDAVLRKQGQAGMVSPNWIRAWLAPFRYEGQAVYVLQIGRPTGGRLLAAPAQSVLHEDVDEARNMVVQDSIYSEGLEKLGFVAGGGPVSRQQERSSLNGAKYFTDGLRAVMFFVTRPLSISDLEILDWVPLGKPAATDAVGKDRHAAEDTAQTR